jgi:hypothetical protein
VAKLPTSDSAKRSGPSCNRPSSVAHLSLRITYEGYIDPRGFCADISLLVAAIKDHRTVLVLEKSRARRDLAVSPLPDQGNADQGQSHTSIS